MVEKGKFYYETPCPKCGRFHSEPLLRPGGHPESSRAYCHVGGTRTEVTIDYEAAGRRLAKKVIGANRGKVSITSKLAGHWAQDVVDAALVEEDNQ